MNMATAVTRGCATNDWWMLLAYLTIKYSFICLIRNHDAFMDDYGFIYLQWLFATYSLGQVKVSDSSIHPLEFKILPSSVDSTLKKCEKWPVTSFGLDFYVCYYELPYGQGQ